MPFGDWIRERRESAGLSQEDLGKLVGRSRQMIQVIERGENPGTGKPVRLTPEFVRSCARAFRAQGLATTDREALHAADFTHVDDAPQPADEAIQLLDRLTRHWAAIRPQEGAGPEEEAGALLFGWRPLSNAEFLEALRPYGPLVPLESIPVANGELPCDFPTRLDGERMDDMQSLVGSGIVGVFAKGDSMEPYFRAGDLVFVVPLDRRPHKGGKYVVNIDGDTTCKVLASIDGWGDAQTVTFEAANSIYPPITVGIHRAQFRGYAVDRLSKQWIDRALRAQRMREPE